MWRTSRERCQDLNLSTFESLLDGQNMVSTLHALSPCIQTGQRRRPYSGQKFDVLGGSGGVVNSLDFCPASFKSLGCFLLLVRTFLTMKGGDNKFVKFTVPTLKAFLKVCSQNVSGNKQ